MREIKLTENQNLKDIQKAMLETHGQFLYQYRNEPERLQISRSPVEQAAKAIFRELRENCAYYVEPANRQTVRSREAIAKGCRSGGIDCKNFTLYISGVLQEYLRQTRQAGRIVWRFAGYEGGEITHVFAILETPNKIFWIDPVLKDFNRRSPKPTIFEEIVIFDNMSLYKIGFVSGELVNDTIEAVTQILTKNGVSPGIFAKYSFLSVLDNSTGKWKSRLAFLQDKTPNERIAFYIEAMKAGEPCEKTVIQYPELFGHQQIAGKGTGNELAEVAPDLKNLYNQMVKEKYLKGEAQIKCGQHTYPASYVILPGAGILENTFNTNAKTVNKAGLGLMLLAGLAGAFFFIKKQPKK